MEVGCKDSEVIFGNKDGSLELKKIGRSERTSKEDGHGSR
jgi:hypothetical protein